jgi:hypothetical protein
MCPCHLISVCDLHGPHGQRAVRVARLFAFLGSFLWDGCFYRHTGSFLWDGCFCLFHVPWLLGHLGRTSVPKACACDGLQDKLATVRKVVESLKIRRQCTLCEFM